jgi:hypothetical protein
MATRHGDRFPGSTRHHRPQDSAAETKATCVAEMGVK